MEQLESPPPNADLASASRAYNDFLDVCAKRYDSTGVMMSLAEWAQNPIYACRLLTPPAEISTNLRISLEFTTPADNSSTLTMFVCPLFSKVVTAAYSAASEYPAVKVEHQL